MFSTLKLRPPAKKEVPEPEPDPGSDETIIYEVPEEYKQRTIPKAAAPQSTKSKFTFCIRVVRLKQHKDTELQQKYDHQIKTAKQFFRCDMCRLKCASTKELNHHYKDTHENLHCEHCDKAFSSPYSLKKHQYERGKKEHSCDKYIMMFAFRSQLNDHSTTHIKNT